MIQKIKNIFLEFLNFIISEEKPVIYLIFFFISFLVMTANYTFEIEPAILTKLSKIKQFAVMFIMHGSVYYGFILVISIAKKKKYFTGPFLIVSLFGTFILSLYRVAEPYKIIIVLMNDLVKPFARMCLAESNGHITITLPLIFFYIIYELRKKEIKSFYGLSISGVNPVPYLFIISCMLPLAYFASLSQSFMSVYPRYDHFWGDYIVEKLNLPECIPFIIFETAYISDFFTIELLFRGFFVIGCVRYLGRDALLPITLSYIVLHFGKPVGETISSGFGGFFLSYMAYKSKNIWGGIATHMSLAFFMEIFAVVKS